MANIYESMAHSEITVWIVNGFVLDGRGGNPAGIVLDADALGENDMQAIATEVALSETAFVSKSASGGFKLDFFTPSRRIAHCGHATIAAFSYLASLGRVTEGATSKQTVDGVRKIVIEKGAAYMEQLAPAYFDIEKWRSVGLSLGAALDSLGLPNSSLDDRALPTVVSTGNRFLIVGVKKGAYLDKLIPNFDAISKISEALDLIGYYVFATDRGATKRDAITRMFAPRYGISEESATGMAAGPLACFLYDRLNLRHPHMLIEQGTYMSPPSPSLIDVRLQIGDEKITGLMVGGRGSLMEKLIVRRSGDAWRGASTPSGAAN